MALIGVLIFAAHAAQADPVRSRAAAPCWTAESEGGQPSAECAAKLEKECLARGGRWGGTESGHGRSPGCNQRMLDAGKPCTESSECVGGCIKQADGAKCAEFGGFRGCGLLQSSPEGIQEICVD